MSAQHWHKAIGSRDGDTLTLSTLFAKITIEQCFDDVNDTITFHLTGDTKPVGFAKLENAITHALEQLAKYTEGRAD